MSLRRRPETLRLSTMVCASCDVTWRGRAGDECWSCGEQSSVHESAPLTVRYTPAMLEDQRLVG